MYLMLKVIKRSEVAILITFERGLIMKILVLVKRVVYPYLRIRVKPDVSGIEAQQLKMVMNPLLKLIWKSHSPKGEKARRPPSFWFLWVSRFVKKHSGMVKL